MNNVEFFRSAGYGMMVHFGVYSMLGGEYRGRRMEEDYAEWIQSYFAIPNAEYEKLARAFNPVLFDAEEWVSFAKSVGMKYIVVTTKHHDGFALFDSRADDYNSVRYAAFGRDIIGELAEACRRHGLKLGFYYSQDLDWHEENGGGYTHAPVGCAGVSWENSWDFPDASKKNYDECFRRKILPQVKELLTRYGDVFLFWFDMPLTMTEEQSRELYDTIKAYHPDCLVNSRLGNGVYDYVSLGDNEIPDSREAWEELSRVDPESIDYTEIGGFKPSKYGLYESACTLNHSWGFCLKDQDWKSAETIRQNRRRLNELGINYLINVGPDALGRIPAPSLEILRDAAEEP